MTDAELDRQQRVLHEAQASLVRHRLKADLVAAVGDPVTEILAAAEERGAVILVVGSSGGARGHLLHRSVSARLVRRARGDVLVVH